MRLRDSAEYSLLRRKYRSDAEVYDALLRSGGVVIAAANYLGISRQALHGRLSRKPELRPQQTATLDQFRAMAGYWDLLNRGLDAGDYNALRHAVKILYPPESKPRRPHPRYSDKQCEEFVVFLKGDLAMYRAYRARAPHAIGTRRAEIERAAALTLNIGTSEVWKRFHAVWLLLELGKLVKAEVMRRKNEHRNRLRKKRAKRRVVLEKNSKCKQIALPRTGPKPTSAA